jgi:hypothetical protein
MSKLNKSNLLRRTTMEKMPIKTKLSFDLKYEVGQRVQPIVIEAVGGILYISVADGKPEDQLRLVVELDGKDKLVACCYEPGGEDPYFIAGLD